jgi:hypothetical protein
MFNGLTTETHGFGLLVKPARHDVEHSLMRPAFDAFDLLLRRTWLEPEYSRGNR